MTTKRPDMESFRKKALSDPAVRAEYEALDTYYKTQRQLISMRLEFRKACASIMADLLFDTVLEMNSCSTSDSARQGHLLHAVEVLKKNIQEALTQNLKQQGEINEDVPNSVSDNRDHHKNSENCKSEDNETPLPESRESHQKDEFVHDNLRDLKRHFPLENEYQRKLPLELYSSN